MHNMDRVTRKDPAGHRERLLAAAITCLQEKGYARTTARDLVAASGTNLASIGYHFGGKEALLNEALAECFRLWTTEAEKAVFASAEAGPGERLARALHAVIAGFAEMRPMVVAFIEALPVALRSEELRAHVAAAYAEARATSADMITRAVAEMEMDVPELGPPEVTASVIIALCDGLMLQWLFDPQATPDAGQVVTALTAMSGALAAEHAGPGIPAAKADTPGG